MLHVLWMVLKIILWILLGIIGLVLLILLLVLFVPVTYKVDAEYDGKARIKAKLRFLIVSVVLRFNQEDKQLENVIRIAGFRIGGGRGRAKPAKAAEDVVEELAEAVDDEGDEGESEVSEQKEVDVRCKASVQKEDDVRSKASEQKQDDLKPKASEQKENAGEFELSEMDSIRQEDSANEEFDLWNNEDKENGEKEGFFARLKILLTKLFEKLSLYTPDKLADRIEDKLAAVSKKKQELENKVDRLKRFWKLSCTVRTRSYLKKYIVSIFRHIAPRRVKGRIHYGFDEPYKTGQITGYLSLMPFVYQKGLSLEPDFYNKVMEGHLYIRGHIQLGYILRIALNLNIWRTVRAVRKLVNK